MVSKHGPPTSAIRRVARSARTGAESAPLDVYPVEALFLPTLAVGFAVIEAVVLRFVQRHRDQPPIDKIIEVKAGFKRNDETATGDIDTLYSGRRKWFARSSSPAGDGSPFAVEP
jgi:hypothetical protein